MLETSDIDLDWEIRRIGEVAHSLNRMLPYCRGWSPEREISLISGQKCAEALQRSGYQVTQIDVDRDLAARLTELAPDVCFNALHGVGGEDGEVQGLLEVLAIPYTHSGVRASALAMDKHLSKKIFADAGLPVARSPLVMRGVCTDHPLDPPYVVKPVNQGSSVGVQIVPEGANELPDTLTDPAGDMTMPQWSKPILPVVN